MKDDPQSDPTYPAKVMGLLLDLTIQRLNQLAAQGVIPHASGGKYPLVASVQGYVRYLRGIARGKTIVPGDQLAERKLRFAHWRAERMRMEVKRLRGSLIPADSLEQALTHVITTVRTRLLGLPRRLAETLAPEGPDFVERKLETEIAAILNELAEDETLPDWLDESADEPPPPRTAPSVG